MLEQLQTDYAALEQRVQQLESTNVTIESLQADYTALTLRVDALEGTTPTPTRALLTPEKMRIVGGYRLPECFYGSNGLTLAFSHCGMSGRNEPDGSLRLWIAHHATSIGTIAEMVAPATRGSVEALFDGSNLRHHWPIASHVRNIPQVYRELYDLDNACQLFGVHWVPELNRLLASGRSWYNTTGGKDGWLIAVDVDQEPAVKDPRITPGLSQQVFGGGFCDIPQWFADAYCNGHTIGLGLGGYESGQASSHAPSLAAWKQGEEATVMMYSKWLTAKENQERRDANYQNGGITWQPNPDGDVGYWGTSRCMDVTWVDTPTCSSFLAISLQPVGTLDYAIQDRVFTRTVQYMLYVYDPADLAKVAQGTLAADQVRGNYYPFPVARGGRPTGMWWDNERQILSVVYANAWTWGGSESYPIVVEFEITE